jgi:hypothetical protein
MLHRFETFELDTHRRELRLKDMKQLPRRQFLHLGVATAALPVAMRYAKAQGYASRPVRLSSDLHLAVHLTSLRAK